jgi:hypothetical protein
MSSRILALCALVILSNLLLSLSINLQNKKVLILQNKGGGHGTIGYYLSKNLAEKGAVTTMLQDKCKYTQEPFSEYGGLKEMGVNIIDGAISEETSQLSTLPSKVDYIIDNWSKGANNASFVGKLASTLKAEQLVFVSSAGMYAPPPDAGALTTEDQPVKKSNEVYIAESTYSKELSIPYTFLRPQYLYGKYTSKRYLDYYLGRILRNLPIPLPFHGEQLVCLTHQYDVANMIALSLGHPAAAKTVFNCGSGEYVTYKGLAELIHDTLKTPKEQRKYIYYDPKELQEEISFPFRPNTFITSIAKVQSALQFTPQKHLMNHIQEEIQLYQQGADMKKEWGVDKELKGDAELWKKYGYQR